MSDYEQLRDEILRLLYEHVSTGSSTPIQSSLIAAQLDLPTVDIDEQLEILNWNGFVDLTKTAGGNHIAVLLPPGKQRVKEGFKQATEAPHYTIGAVIDTMSGGMLQAVGSASDADISQIVKEPALMQSQVEELTANLIELVKHDLSAPQLVQYIAAIRDLQNELLSEKSNPSTAKRLLGTLALLGDVDGSIGLMVKVWPYISALLMIAGQKIGVV